MSGPEWNAEDQWLEGALGCFKAKTAVKAVAIWLADTEEDMRVIPERV